MYAFIYVEVYEQLINNRIITNFVQITYAFWNQIFFSYIHTNQILIQYSWHGGLSRHLQCAAVQAE